MKENIEKTIIESLFLSDTEVLFVELRNRAEKANMPMPDFHTAFTSALKSGQIEADKFGNVKLMGDIEPPKQQFTSELKEGVKTANNLCAAVKLDMQMLFENVATSTDNIEVWEKRLNDSIAYNAQLFPRCTLPHVTKWTSYKGNWHVNAYASQIAYVRGGAFLTISCKPFLED